MIADRWVRITFFLPVTRASDRTAFYRFIDYLKSQHPAAGGPTLDLEIEGFSYSITDPAPVLGMYWSRQKEQEGWVPDDIVLVTLDRPGEPIQDSAPIQEADLLKAKAVEFYSEEGARQEDFWCSVNEVRIL
jgi:hypothetical protein